MSPIDEFRQQTRAWLEENCPESQRRPVVKEEQIWAGRDRVFATPDAKLWFERMRDKGWTAPTWPIEYGGGGLTSDEEKVLEKEMARLNCRPPLYDLGLWMLGPALLVHGNEAQKQEHISKIVRGDIRWAQGYSEPAAGSDLASLKTRAEDMGDHFLVNGTKIWTTQADKADWIFALVRTDSSGTKHQGISFILIDMRSAGVSTTPIELISGDSEFCQTFFDDVKVPKENIVGELNNGWAVAKELLKHERKLMATMESIVQREDESLVELATEYIGMDESGKLNDSTIRSRITDQLMTADALEYLNERLFFQYRSKQVDSGLPLTVKYLGTNAIQQKDELLLLILGNHSLSWQEQSHTPREHNIVQNWAYNKAHTIAGGTSEIQLNIIAKRALGLPA
ncbi:acyl-CoA dehydrogenase family protein [SAR92 clade bacterium H455]|uniref:Acyl-CoA dehydrogenase family protein n=1 Tax=SAR92 clade bacterium H455 TaxID=2974818 RepID=A0ABY5TPS5_9GAMM|nr:acyl-CoA dehydrogenase family protein [SAR92 clade bacterium H455]